MHRKLLDEGLAGDNVGVLLRGVARDDIERGQVLSKPGALSLIRSSKRKSTSCLRTKVVVIVRSSRIPSTVLLPHDGCDGYRDIA